MASSSSTIPHRMKAVIQTKYGYPKDILEVSTIPVPQLKPNQLLINVKAASVNPVDWKLMDGNLSFFLRRKFPHVPLFDVAGIVVAKGEKAGDIFKIGDEVYGDLDISNGAAAEYVATTQTQLWHKPKNLDFFQAAAVPLTGLTSYQGLVRHGLMRAGDNVVVLGASGGVGVLAVQFAKCLNARKVWAVCSAKNAELVKSLGADEVIDYKSEKYGEKLKTEKIDLVFDATGGYVNWVQGQKCLKQGGRYVTIANDTTQPKNLLDTVQLISGIVYRRFVRSWLPPYITYTTYIADTSRCNSDLEIIKRWIEDGRVKVVVEKVYEMEEVKEMFERSMSHRARGKLIMKISSNQRQSITQQTTATQ